MRSILAIGHVTGGAPPTLPEEMHESIDEVGEGDRLYWGSGWYAWTTGDTLPLHPLLLSALGPGGGGGPDSR